MRLSVLLLLGALTACASQRLHHQASTLFDNGKTDEGLATLSEALAADPGNIAYRVELQRRRAEAVNPLLALAAGEREAGRPEAARSIYLRALQLDPDNHYARNGLASLDADSRAAAGLEEARALLGKGQTEPAQALLQTILLENPRYGPALALRRQLGEQAASAANSAPVLRASLKKPVTLQFRDANLKMVFEALARTSGINILLDRDVKPELKTSIFVKDVSVEDTIDLILLQNKLEKKVISDNTVFVYPGTPDKLKDYQDLKIRSFHLSNADPKQMLTMIKTLLKTRDIFVHEKTNSVVMRDTPDAIRLAEKLVHDQDKADPEVMLEVEVLEVTRSRLSEIGIKYPAQLNFTAAGTGGGSGSSGGGNGSPSINDLRGLNGSGIVVSPAPSVTLNMRLEDGDTNVLASPRIRAKNREKARIMIGDRVPVITNAITPVSTGTPVVTGNVQYLDVGLKLEVEPEIGADSDVTIKVSLEVSSIIREILNAQSGTLAYQVGTRNASTVLQLKDGETQVLAGLLNDEDRETASKVPLIGQLPILGRLFSSHKSDGKKTEIVLSITPRLVGRPGAPDAREIEYWSGTEASLRSAPLLLKPMGTVGPDAGGGTPAGVATAQGSPNPGLPPDVALQATPAPRPVNLSWNGPSQARVGDQVRLTLNTEAGQGMSKLGLLVGFDPEALRAVEVVDGDLARQGGAQAAKAIDQAGGQVTVELSGMQAGAGQGEVATLVFEVLAVRPETRVAVTRVVPAGADGQALAYIAPGPYSLVLMP